MRWLARRADEAGIAIVTVLLVTMLILGLMAGMFAAVNSDLRSQSVDRDQTQVYAAAHAGLEKLTSDLASLFTINVAPTVGDIEELEGFRPEIEGFTYEAPGGGVGSGYDVSWTPDEDGNPKILVNADITAGPYTGFKGLITPYEVTVTARSRGGSEVRLRRELQTVAIPVFQFGVFSETDLTFYAGDNFDFGGRVHTNRNLFVSELSGFTLKFTDRITAVGEVIRKFLSNGKDVTTVSFTGPVNMPTAIGNPGTYRTLKYQNPNEGSVAGMPGSLENTDWSDISVGEYKNNVMNGLTGARRLDLPLVSQGAEPIDLIRRPPVNEATDGLVFGQRYFAMASLRILLSDRMADIEDLPTVTQNPDPILLGGDWLASPPTGYGPVDATHPPIARSIGLATATVNSSSGISSSSPTMTINVNSVPARFRLGTNTINIAGHVLTCTGKTPSTFSGCTGWTGLGTIPGSTPITATLPGSPATTTNALPFAFPATTINTVTSGTASFSPIFFFTNATGNPTPISCTGFDETASLHRFTGCAWVNVTGATAPANSNPLSTHAHVDPNAGLIDGFIKIERQNEDRTWTDVTMEILNLGIGAPNQEGNSCGDPTPDAVLRLQRLRDHGNSANGSCTYAGSRNSYDWWPNALFDAREGNRREVATSTAIEMGGVMHYIALDVRNLKRWLAGEIGTTGTQARNNQGYIVYFSDRRGNHRWDEPDDPETGEYGWEDVVNPASSTGVPNGTLQEGENVNGPGNTVVDVYGAVPEALVISPGASNPFTTDATNGARPTRTLNSAQARVNRTVLFRRALKLVNGGIVSVSGVPVNSLPTDGLTVTSENPVYVQGNYNATTDPNAEPNVPAAIVADAVTVLSNNWTDVKSFRYPNNRDERDATTTGYRFAVIAGKNPSFTYPTAGTPQFLFGTDGGVGNFLRLLENWNIGGVSINYRGSIVSLYFSRQATGTFRFSTNVYSYGDRNFTFDTDFLTPDLLPPGTPMFRDVNTLTFRQILRPNQ